MSVTIFLLFLLITMTLHFVAVYFVQCSTFILYYFLLGILIASQSNILIAFVTDIVNSLKIIYICAIIKVPTKSSC